MILFFYEILFLYIDQSNRFNVNFNSNTKNKGQVERTNEKADACVEYKPLKLSKISFNVPKNHTNKKLNEYKVKNYKEFRAKLKPQSTDNANIEVLYILTDNSLIAVQMPNLDFKKEDTYNTDFGKSQIPKSLYKSNFNFENFMSHLKLDYKVTI